jgi:prepilin-type N-terminal cleavage/methylation domain-containing protein
MIRQERCEPGFTLLEVMVAVSFLAVSLLAAGMALQSGILASRELREHQLVQARAQSLVDAVVNLGFGDDSDPDPTVAQLSELLDGDDDFGNITLNQLSRWPPQDGGWLFRLQGIGVRGEWLLSVDRDADGDGAVAGDLEESRQIYRIRIFFNNRLFLQTHYAREVTL